MNRHERRAAKARKAVRERTIHIPIDKLDSTFDIQIEGKFERVVMILANPKGRKIVEDLWPDVEWTEDEKFSSVHSADWLFTHIRVTRLPPHLEQAVPLAFASPDSLGFAVAMALHRCAWPLRIAYWIDEGIQSIEGPFKSEGADTALYAEYVPPGVYSAAGRDQKQQ
jgi:hypothetical protein